YLFTANLAIHSAGTLIFRNGAVLDRLHLEGGTLFVEYSNLTINIGLYMSNSTTHLYGNPGLSSITLLPSCDTIVDGSTYYLSDIILNNEGLIEYSPVGSGWILNSNVTVNNYGRFETLPTHLLSNGVFNNYGETVMRVRGTFEVESEFNNFGSVH